MPFLDPDVLRAAVARGPWGPVQVVTSTGSTNADLAASARVGAPAGSVLVSAHQSSGRGRFRRSWEAPPDTAVALSVLVAPRRETAAWGWLSLLAGMAVTDALGDVADVPARLKWPNDVLIGERKVCGILAEAVPVANGTAAVVGLGINLTLTEDQLPVPTATSLRLAGAADPDATAVAAAVLGSLASWYARWESGEDLADAYRSRSATIGRAVAVHAGAVHAGAGQRSGEPVTGTAVDIDAGGALVVRTASGPRVFAAGDVVHLR